MLHRTWHPARDGRPEPGAGHAGEAEPGDVALPKRNDDGRRQQRAESGTGVAADLEGGLRQAVATARGQAGNARRLGIGGRPRAVPIFRHSSLA